MGITHIEDLKIDNFIIALKQINDYEVSEKIDGTINIAVGADARGLFVARPSKGQSDRIYVDKWPSKPMYNAFRFAFSAFKSVEKELITILQPHNGIVEFEVLYGFMPNAIAYDNEGLVILRTISGPLDLSVKLAKVIKGRKISISNIAYHYGINGRLYSRNEKHIFTFFYKQIVKPPKYNPSMDLRKIQQFLKRKSKMGITNYDVLKTSLSKVVKQKRAAFKSERNRIENQLYTLKVDIKKNLQDIFLYSVSSTLSPDIDFIEGVVLRDKTTNQLVKIVDRDVFTGVNKFLWHFRELISSGIMTDKGWEKSILVRLREAIGDTLGVPIMKTLRGKKMARENPIELYKMLLRQGFDFKDHTSALNKIGLLVRTAQKELDDLHLNFKAAAMDKTLTKNFNVGGRTVKIKYDKHTIKKTQDSLFDAKSALRTIIDSIKNVEHSLTEYEAWLKIFQIYSMI